MKKKNNFVAKHAKSTTSGAGVHKDRKKAMKQGETKHKKEKFTEVSANLANRVSKARRLQSAQSTVKGLSSLKGDEVARHSQDADRYMDKAHRAALYAQGKNTVSKLRNENFDHSNDRDLSNVHPDEYGSSGEYDMEGSYVKNQIHTMLRVLSHLERALDDEENLPEWVEDKMSQAKGMLVSVMDYIISEKEIALDSELGDEGHMMAEAKKKPSKNHPWKGSKAIADKNRKKSLKQPTSESYENRLAESLNRAIRRLR